VLLNLSHVKLSFSTSSLILQIKSKYCELQAKGDVSSFFDFKPCLTAKANVLWQENWTNSSRFKGTRLFQLKLYAFSPPWYIHYNIGKLIICLIYRIRIGHAYNKSHLFRINVANNENCDCGIGEGATIDDVILSCLSVPSESRNSFFKELKIKSKLSGLCGDSSL
jgi:hypothetical protein